MWLNREIKTKRGSEFGRGYVFLDGFTGKKGVDLLSYEGVDVCMLITHMSNAADFM